ncbi:MAG TPA: EamA family transporter [Methylomirabilota bacterium]|nr:EamA family transporter [Methylomirabilota bacterium]
MSLAGSSALAELVMLGANVVYGTSYVVARVTLDSIPPALLAFLRLVIAALILAMFSRRQPAEKFSREDQWAIAWMGIIGFAGAYVCSNWGIAHSTATNGALLITVEPIAMILLSPWYLGERLSGRGAVGAALTIVGTVVLVVNGIPGLTEKLVPHWAGDLVLVLAGVAYASYSLLGRRVLERHAPLPVTTRSLVWGAAALMPIAAVEWASGARPVWTGQALAGALYLAVVITALGYVVWNWALARVPAPRAAIFLNVQPIVGALLGPVLLGEPFTIFTALGGALVVTGLAVAFWPGGR